KRAVAVFRPRGSRARAHGPDRGRERADRAAGRVVAQRRAVLAPEVDDLQVQPAPALRRIKTAQVLLGPADAAPVREPPPRGEAMDVGVDRERRDTERLREHDARRLAPDAGQRLERLAVARHLPAVLLDELARERGEVPGLR